jgi:hypothetical protein
MAILIGINEPFTKKSDEILALINEFFCLLVNYHLLIFSDWVPDGPARDTMGYTLICVTILNITINITWMSINSTSGLCRIAKLHWKRYKLFKAHKLRLKKKIAKQQKPPAAA